MATLQIEPTVPPLTPAASLTGWRREFCVELLGDGAARIFVRAVEEGSHKASELKRGILFCRLDPRFGDLASCIEAVRFELDRLVDTARRVRPEQENLFCAVTYDRAAWEGVQSAIDQWVRRRHDPVHAVVPPRSHLREQRGDVL
jgi:hypothetical protein